MLVVEDKIEHTAGSLQKIRHEATWKAAPNSGSRDPAAAPPRGLVFSGGGAGRGWAPAGRSAAGGRLSELLAGGICREPEDGGSELSPSEEAPPEGFSTAVGAEQGRQRNRELKQDHAACAAPTTKILIHSFFLLFIPPF